MALAISTEGEQVLATLSGELTIYGVTELQQELLALLAHPQVVLSFAGVTELDGCAVQLLLILRMEAARVGCHLAFLPDNSLLTEAWSLLGQQQLLVVS
ncbi:STAS domain-containing protein [Neisseriaceae bacterium TC5R-5]|nr:STAS domain-containing protein [Neisseriaceae bacterium TC5R-5]